MELSLPIKDIINLCYGQDNPNSMIKKLSLSYTDMVYKILADVDSFSSEQLETVGQILFDDDEYPTYKEVWSNWESIMVTLSDAILLQWLIDFKPGKHSDECLDVALNWLMYNKYGVHYFDDLSGDIQESLIVLFNDDLPEEIKKFNEKIHFIDEMVLFQDFDFLDNNIIKFDFEVNEIKEILCQIVKDGKIDTIEKLKNLCSYIKAFKPKNSFDRKYGDAFVLEVFESVESVEVGEWSDEFISVWKEVFNIYFEWVNLYTVRYNINTSCAIESKYIDEQLKINHD